MSNLNDCIINLAMLSKSYNDTAKSKDMVYTNAVNNIKKLLKRYADCDHALDNCECKIKDSNDWFEKLFGITEKTRSEENWKLTKSKFKLERNFLTAPNGEKFNAGDFKEYDLRLLKHTVSKTSTSLGLSDIKVEHFITHGALLDHNNYPGAIFQVASGLNYLEFVGPAQTPEYGITDYINDDTQGPDCALACAAGTFVRNYFKQTPNKQLNMLAVVEKGINNETHNYFKVENGYISSTSIKKLKKLNSKELESNKDIIRDLILIGIQHNVGVCFKDRTFTPIPASQQVTVNQVYSAALSLGYLDKRQIPYWEPLARLVLEANYEGALLAAIISGNKTVILTMVGGGVFKNPKEWIIDAINRAIKIIRKLKVKLTIKIAHYKKYDDDYTNSIK